MATSIRWSDSGRYWVIEVSGLTQVESARETLRQLSSVIEMSREAKPAGFLFDMRCSRNGLSNLDKYQLAYGPFSDIKAFSGAKVAILVSEGDSGYDFTFTLTRNIGLMSKLFTNEQECLTWLQAEKTKQPQI